ncbi:WD40 repeat domain-containing protein KNAG_0I01650 [Huiozyma naganishii CBS 8797]|uniref:Autophagy-related protein 18 n=1 Tax=Huiozyma naganishii (strain ATCC MYA-139 / BCRC 22969 / CBS 8797 / KCTC 17520 / NBRC 10181 / NCYC 3082 / Yp74L-3) TaxID=1071383 RepID=J7RAP7_HUIN7|nr:hypothetical protein KNAG_0I01650 [Kazachstania naganishii CBS 8797]CCK71950.1 hypothetical protein KNAG_0I01650 [Kazachstania naganishii CBS 8797]
MAGSEQSLGNYVNFNQNGSCISVGTSNGFKVFNCEPFGRFYSESEPEYGGYSIVEMLFSTSLVALVGNGDQPQLSPRILKLANTKKHTVICEIMFPSSILSVKMNKSKLIVVLKTQIYVYDITSMRLLYIIENTPNPYGLATLSSSSKNSILVYPSPSQLLNSEILSNATTNNITIPMSNRSLHGKTTRNNIQAPENVTGTDPNATPSLNQNNDGYNNGNASNNIKSELSSVVSDPDSLMKNGDVIIFDLNALQPIMVIEAHKNSLASLVLSPDGSLLATASEKGTIVRIFSVETGLKLYQFRRGTYQAKIYSMCFSSDNQFLAISCSTKTVHVFKMESLVSGTALSTSDDDSETAVTDERFIGDTDAGEPAGDSLSASGTKSREPYVDMSRKTVGRMIRNSSQNLTRKAAKTLGQIFPIKVNSILEPSRHFASLKIPFETDKNVKSIVSVGTPTELNLNEYPELSTINEADEESGDRDVSNPSTVQVLPIKVITLEGYLYNYVLDPKRGGDCLLLSQYSLLHV